MIELRRLALHGVTLQTDSRRVYVNAQDEPPPRKPLRDADLMFVLERDAPEAELWEYEGGLQAHLGDQTLVWASARACSYFVDRAERSRRDEAPRADGGEARQGFYDLLPPRLRRIRLREPQRVHGVGISFPELEEAPGWAPSPNYGLHLELEGVRLLYVTSALTRRVAHPQLPPVDTLILARAGHDDELTPQAIRDIVVPLKPHAVVPLHFGAPNKRAGRSRAGLLAALSEVCPRVLDQRRIQIEG